MGIVDKDGSVNVSVDSTFMKAYSRRGPKGGKSDRGARVGKTDRRNCELGACYGKRISHVIADRQYYSSEAFSMIGK